MESEQRSSPPVGSLPDADHLSAARPGDPVLGRVLGLVRHLRAHCPWDARQTPRSLVPFLLEEADEVADSILAGDDAELRGELGDLLLNVAFQVVLAEERRAFRAEDVVELLERKMVERHPHVYGDRDEPPDWEELKREARSDSRRPHGAGDGTGDAEGDSGSGGEVAGDPGQGVARALTPLARARRVQARAARSGFDWPHASESLDKVLEEVRELRELLRPEVGGEDAVERPADAAGSHAAGSHAADSHTGGSHAAGSYAGAIHEEIGDLLFTAVNVARLAGVDPDRALGDATDKFRHRFRWLARIAEERGVDTADASLEELESLWSEAKDRLQGGGGP